MKFKFRANKISKFDHQVVLWPLFTFSFWLVLTMFLLNPIKNFLMGSTFFIKRINFCCLRKHFCNQNWWVTSQALIWHYLQWYRINLRCATGQKRAKKGPKLHFEASRGFVYFILNSKLERNNNKLGTFSSDIIIISAPPIW